MTAMHLYEKTNKINKKLIVAALIFILIIALLIFAIDKTTQMTNAEEVELLYNAINKAVINCYSIEGRYPESIDYIVSNYGVIINEDKYLIDYQIFASNVRPSIRVIEKGARNE